MTCFAVRCLKVYICHVIIIIIIIIIVVIIIIIIVIIIFFWGVPRFQQSFFAPSSSVAVVLRRPRGFLLARARTCGASGCLLCRPLMPPVSPTRLPAGIQPVPVAQMHSVAFFLRRPRVGAFLTTFKQLL